ncbi:MAG: Lactose transport system permease protein LacF [Spirochaetes bacterium ADurb.Bin110]|nr:MAG: Lactose transport system permease protein LacF [Spirochaetes bacterium ADurb.Bin110]
MNKRTSETLWISFFIAPALIIVCVIIILPLFMSLFNSLFLWDQLIRQNFVGFQNFKKIFFTEPYHTRFANAMGNNLRWLVLTMIVQNVGGLFIGYFLSRRIWGHEFYKRIIFIPVLFSIVAVSFLWSLYLRPNGLVNAFLKLIGLPQFMRPWLGDESIATYSIIFVNIWRWIGFPSLVFLAAIDNVPMDCLEAACLDGASDTRVFFKVILPLIVPSIVIITVLTIIGSLNVFEQIYTMAGLDGSPNFSTDTIGTLFYRTAFGSVDSGKPEIGIGSAIGVIIYLLTFVVSLISIVTLGKKEVEL